MINNKENEKSINEDKERSIDQFWVMLQSTVGLKMHSATITIIILQRLILTIMTEIPQWDRVIWERTIKYIIDETYQTAAQIPHHYRYAMELFKNQIIKNMENRRKWKTSVSKVNLRLSQQELQIKRENRRRRRLEKKLKSIKIYLWRI